MTDRVGFVGLGVMGSGMAANLARTGPVLGYDLDPARLAGLRGVERAAGLPDIAKQCTVVCLSLPSAPVVEQVVTGLAEGLASGSLVIDLSTTLPSVSRRVAAALARQGVDFVDAPVSGGEAGARDATLAIMVGASPGAWERCRPWLSRIGATVTRVGDVGAGGVAKLVNNMIVGAAFAVIAEGFALAAANGIDAAVLYEAIRGGWAGSKVLDVSGPAIASRDYRPGGTIDMLKKDLDYARTLAAECRVPIPMSAMAHEVFVAGQAAGQGSRSQPAVIELWRSLLDPGRSP